MDLTPQKLSPPSELGDSGYINLEKGVDLKFEQNKKCDFIVSQREQPNTEIAKKYEIIKNTEKRVVLTETRYNYLNTKTCQVIKNQRELIDYQKLLSLSQKQFYDYRVFEILACVANMAVYVASPYDKDQNNANLRLFWQNLKRLSGGEYGETYTTLKQDLDDVFIIKYYKSDYDYDRDNQSIVRSNNPEEEVMHELFIASLLRKYRQIIPNFMLGYGFFECSNPFQTPFKQIKSVCDFKGDSYYGIFERINPGPPFKDYLRSKDVRLSQILGYFLQILFALSATKEFEYTHSDLHTENIIFRNKPKNTVIQYRNPLNNKPIYIKSDYIAMIIDYGMSYVKYNGVDHGDPNLNYPDQSNPIRDAFKMVMFSIEDLSIRKDDLGKDLIDQLRPLYQFFDRKDTLEEHLELRYDYSANYHFDAIPTRTYNHTQLISFVLDFYKDDLKMIIFESVPKGERVLSCAGLGCSTTSVIFKSASDPPQSIFRLYDMLTSGQMNALVITQYQLNLDKLMNESLRESALMIQQGNSISSEIQTGLESTSKLYSRFKRGLRSLLGRNVQNNLESLRSVAKILPSVDNLIGIVSLLLIYKDAYITIHRKFKRDDLMAKIEQTNKNIEKIYLDWIEIQTFLRSYYEENKIWIWQYYAELNIKDQKTKVGVTKEEYNQFRDDFDLVVTTNYKLNKKMSMKYDFDVYL